MKVGGCKFSGVFSILSLIGISDEEKCCFDTFTDLFCSLL